jgi:hypothetical protein
MSTIDPTGRLLAYLRQQTQDLRRQYPPATGVASDGQQGKPAGNKDALALASQQILSIQQDDPNRQRKAFRIYLTCVLVQEFGTAVTVDPGFSGLVDRVQDTMEADAQLLRAMEEAGELLLRNARSGNPS